MLESDPNQAETGGYLTLEKKKAALDIKHIYVVFHVGHSSMCNELARSEPERPSAPGLIRYRAEFRAAEETGK